VLNSRVIYEASILIVDDLQPNVILLEQLLRNEGYSKLQTTTDPYAVCDLHRLHRYDLILLDLKMPGMDGFAVMSGLKAMDTVGYAPILAITVDPELRLRALSSGAKDFIAKPYDQIELISRIYNMLEVRLLYKALAQSVRDMESIALHDELTGLPNRRLLLDRMHQAGLVSARFGNQTALMFLDLDEFKQVNDRFGHKVGDLLLQQVAARMQSCLREGDSVSRMGGDEFVVLLEALSSHRFNAATHAQRVARKMLVALEQPYILHEMSLHSTASIGVVLFSDNILDCDALLKMADSAMYRAKAAGRNQICFFDPILEAATTVPSAQLLLTDRSGCNCNCQVASAAPDEPAPLPIALNEKPELSP
jgi:diguanylate cyclase (GGDEF)-like protein